MEKKAPISELMATTMEKIRDMVDSNSIIGQPITTPDGVTVIPISRVTFGFGTGGSDYGKAKAQFGGGSGAGAKIEPVAFLILKNGSVRMVPVSTPALTTMDRVVELVPQVMDRVEHFVDKKKAEKDII